MKEDKTKEECCEKCLYISESKGYVCGCLSCPCHSTPEPKEINVCPAHGNKEYKIESPHYCRYKISEGCSCKCTCPTPKNVSWSEEFDELYLTMPDRLKGNQLAEKFFPIFEEYGKEIKSFISKVESQTRQNTIKEILQKIEGAKKKFDPECYYPAFSPLNDPTGIEGYNQALSDLKQSLEELLK